jgi:hypothetical protein
MDGYSRENFAKEKSNMKASEGSHRVYARVAGFTFLFYIIAGISSMARPAQVPLTEILPLLLNLSALVLGVTLYMITRAQEPALALLAFACRILEAVHDESAIFFAVGSAFFCWLLLRGRMIPIALAWLGVIASGALALILPLQLAGLFGGSMSWSASITWLVWLPMLIFEVTLALWLILKGVITPQTSQTARENNLTLKEALK